MDLDKKTKRSLATTGAYKHVFLGSDEGKKVLWDLMKKNSMIGVTHVPGDPYSTAYNEGCRASVLEILNKLSINTTKLETMIRENLEEEERLGEGL